MLHFAVLPGVVVVLVPVVPLSASGAALPDWVDFEFSSGTQPQHFLPFFSFSQTRLKPVVQPPPEPWIVHSVSASPSFFFLWCSASAPETRRKAPRKRASANEPRDMVVPLFFNRNSNRCLALNRRRPADETKSRLQCTQQHRRCLMEVGRPPEQSSLVFPLRHDPCHTWNWSPRCRTSPCNKIAGA